MAATLQRERQERVQTAVHGLRNLEDSLTALFLALLGGGVGALILFAEPVGSALFGWHNPFLEKPYSAFVAQPDTQLWLFGLGAQTALMAILSVPAARMARELREERATTAALAGLVLVAGVIAVFAVISDHVRPDYPFPHHVAKLDIITGLGLLTCAPGILTIWRVHGALQSQFRGGRPHSEAAALQFLRRLDRTQPGMKGNPVAGFLRLRELVHRSLLLVGALIGGAILGAGALRNAANTFHHSTTFFPIEYVLLYGAFFSLVLVAVYLPTYNQLQLTGRWLVEHYAKLCDPDDPGWDGNVAKRAQLISLLQLELSLSGSLQAGVAILAPLGTALLGLLLPGA